MQQQPSPQPSGLATIFEGLRPELLRFLIARTGETGDADDILQEVWLRLRSVDSGPVRNGRAYLYRMAQNLVLDRLRERRRREIRDHDWIAAQRTVIGGEPVAQDLRADERLIEQEDAERLARAITALPEGAGRAFRLHKIEGLPHAEVAARLGISRSGVEKHIATAMAHLRRAMKD